MEETKTSYEAGGNVNWYSHYGKQYGGFSEKLKMELPYDPAIPLLGIYLKKKKEKKSFIQKEICTSMFMAALFTIAKTWKQPTCPSTDECIKKMWYIYIYHTHTHAHKHTQCNTTQP